MTCAERMKQTNGEHPLGDIGQLVFLVFFLLVWIADSFFLRGSTGISKHVPLYVRLIVLALLLVTGLYLYRSGHTVTRHGERPEGVVTTGAFRYVRHPLYLASMLTYLGLAVSTVSLVSLAVLVIIFFFYNYIASYEERLLELEQGEAYKSYAARTGKWLPGIGKRS
jgi:protein-S-isoprenylcysteine O-methyltransferase Ste14